MSPLIKNIAIALVAVLLLLAGYMYFRGGDEEELVSLSGEDSATEAFRETQKFLGYKRDLERIDLDGELFTDARFTSLIDYRQEIPDEPTGRQNPFEPAL